MSNVPIRKRSDRVATLQMDSFSWAAFWNRLTQPSMLLRFAMLAGSILIVTVAMRGWNPPFPYREGYVPARAIVARVPFEVLDEKKTALIKAQAGREVLCYYENRKQPLIQLRSAIREQLLRLANQTEYANLTEEQKNALKQLVPPSTDENTVIPQQVLSAIQTTLSEESQIEKLDSALKFVFDPIEDIGLLESLDHNLEQGNQRAIRVFQSGQEKESVEVDVKRVRIVEVAPTIHENLKREIKKQFGTPEGAIIADSIFHFLQSRFPDTLTWRQDLTQQARIAREEEVKPAMIQYFASVTTMVTGGKPLGSNEIEVLRAEYRAWLAEQSIAEKLIRLTAFFGMLAAISLLCGLFIYFQLDRTLLTDNSKLIRLLSLSVGCILLCAFAAQDPWRAKILPLVLCAMTATISYGRSVTLMLLTGLSLAITLALGMDIAEFVILLAVSASSTLLLGRVRNRTRLLYVACGAAAVVAMTTIGVGAMVGQVNGISQEPETLSVVRTVTKDSTIDAVRSTTPLLAQLAKEAGRHAMFTILAGLIMTGLLPFVEKIFDVQTDLSLLELGDSSHQLLRQLAQRAPGTYNHSITVAAIAESAADSIGANGLLTRVGAYFHDIGKMFKPNYFIENQAQGVNCHDALQPAMSTLVIIAHVKDGADLARQHHLPKKIIDFIEQHHGTTLVEYFYKQAKKNEDQPNHSQVSEATFRYPGPKPQTLEAAVMMIADAVESASRTLVEPTPTRLQNLIEAIAMKRLTDGQFDECGLTLTQLNTVKTAILKSLTAIYHHRVKYDEKTA